MARPVKKGNKGLTVDSLAQLGNFISKVKKGAITPFKKKTMRARKNLKKARLIK